MNEGRARELERCNKNSTKNLQQRELSNKLTPWAFKNMRVLQQKAILVVFN